MNNIIDGLTRSTYVTFTMSSMYGTIEVIIAIMKKIDPIIEAALSPSLCWKYGDDSFVSNFIELTGAVMLLWQLDLLPSTHSSVFHVLAPESWDPNRHT